MAKRYSKVTQHSRSANGERKSSKPQGSAAFQPPPRTLDAPRFSAVSGTSEQGPVTYVEPKYVSAATGYVVVAEKKLYLLPEEVSGKWQLAFYSAAGSVGVSPPLFAVMVLRISSVTPADPKTFRIIHRATKVMGAGEDSVECRADTQEMCNKWIKGLHGLITQVRQAKGKT